MPKDFTKATGQGAPAPAGGTGSKKDNRGLLTHVAEINTGFKEEEIQKRAKELKVQYVNLRTFPVNPDVFQLLPLAMAKAAKTVPFLHSGKNISLGTTDVASEAFQKLRASFQEKGWNVTTALFSEDSYKHVLGLYQESGGKKEEEVLKLDEQQVESFQEEAKKVSGIAENYKNMSEKDILNETLLGAVKTGASDIHFQPEADVMSLRLRVDGLLHEMYRIPKEVYLKVLTQMKFNAEMKLNVGYKPQDGKFSFKVTGRSIDVRMSTLPTEYGEAVVLRLLDSKKKAVSFEDLGFLGKNKDFLEHALTKTEGMILVTGPTGSGKTTTLYSVLHRFNKPETKIITLEDPIEYHLPNISQSQIKESEGYTFALGLRAILRQDPNVVMLGEIRDKETADIAIQAALTGHIMLSTVHTNSALETLPRLLNMGVKRYLVAPAIHLIVAQRLVRKVCPHCAQKVALKPEDTALFEETIAEIKKYQPDFEMALPTELAEGKGCNECSNTGYLGQIGVNEVLPITHEMKKMILEEVPQSQMEEQARKDGMIPMKYDAILKAMQGITTVAETHRVAED